MRTLKLSIALYAIVALVLLLRPPWADDFRGARFWHQIEANPNSLGHHSVFSLPYYWGWQRNCVTPDGPSDSPCSVWEPDDLAIVDLGALGYELTIGLAGSILASVLVVVIFDLWRAQRCDK